MDPLDEIRLGLTRRQFFGRSATGIGAAALASLLDDGPAGAATTEIGRARRPDEAARAAAGQAGDLPVHARRPVADGPVRLQAGPEPAARRGPARLDPREPASDDHELESEDAARGAVSPFKFAQHGALGGVDQRAAAASGDVADDLCFIRSVHTEAINHDPAVTFLQTGHQQPGRPSFGSWVSYGLGQRESRPAGFRRADLARQRRIAGRPALRPALGLGVSSFEPPGRGLPLQWRSGVVPVESRGRVPCRPPADARNPGRAEPASSRRRPSTRRSTPASRSTRWPIGCRRRCPS